MSKHGTAGCRALGLTLALWGLAGWSITAAPPAHKPADTTHTPYQSTAQDTMHQSGQPTNQSAPTANPNTSYANYPGTELSNAAKQMHQPVFVTPAADKEARSVLIDAHVPAQADVWIDDQKMSQTGTQRRFMSPPLSAGNEYRYDIYAHWMDGDQPMDVHRRVYFRPGQHLSVRFAIGSEGPTSSSNESSYYDNEPTTPSSSGTAKLKEEVDSLYQALYSRGANGQLGTVTPSATVPTQNATRRPQTINNVAGGGGWGGGALFIPGGVNGTGNVTPPAGNGTVTTPNGGITTPNLAPAGSTPNSGTTNNGTTANPGIPTNTTPGLNPTAVPTTPGAAVPSTTGTTSGGTVGGRR